MEYIELKQGELLLGTLETTDLDQPWVICKFTPTPAFEAVKPLFDAELELIEGSDDLEIDAWEMAYSRIDELGLQLVPVNGEPSISEFVLHIDGSEAWFRY
jgi:hypothetical protein